MNKILANKQIDFQKELEYIRSGYIKKPLKDIKIKRPDWMGRHDGLNAVFEEKKDLLSSGKIYLAQVVQANQLLYERKSKENCPAMFAYSTDEAANADRTVIREITQKLWSYKNKDLSKVPEEWREAARIITDEKDRTTFSFTVHGSNGPIVIYFVAVMIFREYLPEKTLIGNVVPILADPERFESALVLPKKYWSKEFIEAWVRDEI